MDSADTNSMASRQKHHTALVIKNIVKIKMDSLKSNCLVLPSIQKYIYIFATIVPIPQNKLSENVKVRAEAMFFHIKQLRVINKIQSVLLCKQAVQYFF